MAQQALGPGTAVPRRRAFFGLLDANGWGWATVKSFVWLIIIIFMLGYLPDRAYYLTVARTVELGVLVWSPINLCPPSNETLPCPAPVGAIIPWQPSPAELNLPAPRTDGSVIQVRAVGRAIDASDRKKGSVWTHEDITEQQRASDELERLLTQQEALLNNVVVGISFARERKVLRCNRRFEELFGYDPGEVTGASTRQFYFTDEEHAEAESHYKEMAAGGTHSREQWMRRRDGTGFWCRMTGRALQPGEADKGTVWLFEDITAGKRASEEVRRALAEQPWAECEDALDGIIIHEVNP